MLGETPLPKDRPPLPPKTVPKGVKTPRQVVVKLGDGSLVKGTAIRAYPLALLGIDVVEVRLSTGLNVKVAADRIQWTSQK